LAVAEKLGRRWVGCDLSKFAIQVTRKRLLDIHNSKDLLNEDEKKKKLYGKPVRPFELWNIGNYETIYWQEKQDEYLTFMLKLYQAQPLTGFRYIHGRKGERAVHIGPLNAPLTMEEVEKVVIECRMNNFNQADVLGWEWSYEVNELAKEVLEHIRFAEVAYLEIEPEIEGKKGNFKDCRFSDSTNHGAYRDCQQGRGFKGTYSLLGN